MQKAVGFEPGVYSGGADKALFEFVSRIVVVEQENCH
jgi:hypothetical protein